MTVLLIGIGHKKGVGKDTVANRLIDTHGFTRMSFADPLKEACRIIFHFTDDQLYGHLKEVLDPRWDKSPREILQKFGSEALRGCIDTDVWIKSLKIKIQNMVTANPNRDLRIVVPDVRFPNEADALHDLGGKLWKITREQPINEFSHHQSETALDDYHGWNNYIFNDSTMQSLYLKTDRDFNDLTCSLQQEKIYAANRRKPEST